MSLSKTTFSLQEFLFMPESSDHTELVNYEKLLIEWEEDEPCPAKAELVIEIISPGQSFGGMTSIATD